ncbi:hypothetical protein GOP47_0024866 [Adiantum capillus-veneris]|uniref:NADP-dependent oxidoreductase domain-containing protein n=1 Tax=Adiantum capillus-veneris TaxID=13818 RepID=A0A9D4Z5F5_ADICA|nr:hypothetical protein GOP47_0024866 [Adiantum capillus-veneris]
MSLEQMVSLGSQGFKVSQLGLGCMGLSAFYGAPVQEKVGMDLIKHAIKSGVSFLDTSNMYGPFTNEVLLGKAIKHFPREHIVKRQRVGELKKLVEEGKVKYIGLSKASSNTIRRAHAVHPITAVQLEWSLWSRDVEEDIIPTCRELGIGIVAYSPLGRGFFSGKATAEALDAMDSRMSHMPRFQGENLEKDKVLYERIANLAKKHGCTPGQLALAWVFHQGDDVVPIPGMTKMNNFDENMGALRVKLSKKDIEEISAAVPTNEVSGGRYGGGLEKFTYKYSETPLLKV